MVSRKRGKVAVATETVQAETVAVSEKKLRLESKKIKEETLKLELSSQTLNNLILFEQSLPRTPQVVEQAINRLIESYETETDKAVRCKLIMIISHLCITPGYDCHYLLCSIQKFIENEESHIVLSQLLDALTTICEISINWLGSKLDSYIKIAIKSLSNTHHSVRCKALVMLGTLGYTTAKPVKLKKKLLRKLDDEHIETTFSDLDKLVMSYFNDQDGRVRVTALETFLKWHSRGILINCEIYHNVCKMLNDDYDRVRFMGAKLICILCHLYPEKEISVTKDIEDVSQTIKSNIMNDGFGKLCQLLSSDGDMNVRAQAAMLLGSLNKVDFAFLEQTLDKILMSDLRRKVSAHERQRVNYETGEWSTGKKWADDAPKEHLNFENITLISMGACGAFVHGLEDEFVEVRNATIDAICKLSLDSPKFAVLCQDSLLDMMNDEIEEARLNAVRCLSNIAAHISLREDQIDVISGCLKDFSSGIRKALHIMFGKVRLSTKVTLKMLLEELLNNLKKYPQDKLSIWQCMQNMGLVNSNTVQCIVPYLLHVHPYFDSTEPDINDPAYVAVLLLVLNAASNQPTILSLLPHHTKKHYYYIRASYPELLPISLNLDKDKQSVISQSVSSFGESYLQQIVQRMPNLEKIEASMAKQVIEITKSDLSRVSDLEPKSAATAEFLVLYLDCIAKLTMIFENSFNISTDLNSDYKRQHFKLIINEVIENCTYMEHVFIGLNEKDILNVQQLKLLANSILLCSILQSTTGCKSLCIQFLKIISDFKVKQSASSYKPCLFVADILKNLKKFESCDPIVFQSTLTPLIPLCKQQIPNILQLTNTLRKAQAKILEPQENSETIHKFTSGLTLSIPLDAIIENVIDLNQIRIQITYPDEETVIIIPRAEDFKTVSENEINLTTNALICHSAWTESAHVGISLVLLCNVENELQNNKNHSVVLKLSDSVKVNVSPFKYISWNKWKENNSLHMSDFPFVKGKVTTLLVGGSFGLKYFTSLRYELRRTKQIDRCELEKLGIKGGKKETLDDQLKDLNDKLKLDNWENIRGPRPWEDSKTIQNAQRNNVN